MDEGRPIEAQRFVHANEQAVGKWEVQAHRDIGQDDHRRRQRHPQRHGLESRHHRIQLPPARIGQKGSEDRRQNEGWKERYDIHRKAGERR